MFPMGLMFEGMIQNMFNQVMQNVMGTMMQKFMGINPGNMQAGPQMLNQIMQSRDVQKTAGPFINGKNQQQLSDTFFNMCKERGIDPNAFAQQMGVTIPK